MGLRVWQRGDGAGKLRDDGTPSSSSHHPVSKHSSLLSALLVHVPTGPVMAVISTSCGRAWLLVRSAPLLTTTLLSAAVWLGSRWVSLRGDVPGEKGM